MSGGPDLFAVLGLERSPALSEEMIEEAYARLALSAHPDRDGGSTARMSELNLARRTLLQSAARIGHFLDAEGYPRVERGAVPDLVGALFGEVASVLNRARAVVEKRDSATSAITRAVVMGEVRDVLGALDGVDGRVRDQAVRLEREVSDWAAVSGAPLDALDTLRRAIAFTERWGQQLAESRAVLGGATRGG